MKQVFYMDGEPIQHLGKQGRELPLWPCDAFTKLDAEHLFISAGKVQGFINNLYRIQSFEESYDELKEFKNEFENQKIGDIPSVQYRAERKVRSFFLEADVFFSHWKRFLGIVNKRSGIDIYENMENRYKTDPNYQLLRLVRNHIMHAGDIIHGSHFRPNEILLWADTEVIKRDIRDKKDKGVLAQFGKKIDLFKLIDDAYPLVCKIHEYLLKSIAEKDKEYNIVGECDYLLSMRSRIILYRSNAWYVFSYTGIENVNVGLPYIGSIPGIGMDYVRLDWNMYQVLKDWVESQKEEST